MSRQEFEEFLSQKEDERKDQTNIDWMQMKNQWLQDLEALYKKFTNSLKDYINKGSIQISYESYTIHEEYIGTYQASGMSIAIAGETIRLKPIGTNLIGAKGRVDMSGRRGSATLLLVDSSMKSIRDHIKIHVYTEAEVKHSKARKLPKPSTRQNPITWEWIFVSPPPTRQYIPVNEDTIYSTIMDLT